MRVPIVHMITGLRTGGSERALARLLARLDLDRYSPTVVSLKDSETAIGDEIRSLKIPVVDLNLDRPAQIGALRRLYLLLRETRPAIVHAWLFHAVMLARTLGRAARVPIIISSRQNVNLGSPIREFINRMTIGIDDRIIAVSQAARRVDIDRGGADPEKVSVVYNGVDPASYPPASHETRAAARGSLGIPPETRLVGTVARLHPSKAIDDLVRAASRVIARLPDTRFLIVGSGEERAGLENLANKLGIARRVDFVGERHDVSSVLSALDVFVLSSREEGMGITLLEAMSTAVPVVATAAGGVVEVIEDGVTGLLSPPGDVERLADSIVSVLESPALAGRISEQGRLRVVERFSIDTTVRQTEKIYEDLLRQKLGSR